MGAVVVERLGHAALHNPCLSVRSTTTRDGYVPLLCANHQVLKGLLILEPVQFCSACPRDFNALVERGNRRYRKMQKQVYRVRTQEQISTRLALDMWREAQAEGRQHTLSSLHQARAG
jgi:hypothetical protein